MKSIDELKKELEENPPIFESQPYYDPAADCIFYFTENTAYMESWQKNGVTHYVDREDKNRIIGFKIPRKLLEL